MTNDEEGSSQPDWKRYPFPIVPADPALVCPLAEGDQGAESNTYYVSGRLQGLESRREWAFLVIFTGNDIRHRLRADFYTLALFDLETGEYGTYTDFDWPRALRWRRSRRLSIERGRLSVTFETTVGPSSWRTRTAADGSLLPFEYRLELRGIDSRQRGMALELDVSTAKPPLPVGGAAYAGVKTCMGQPGTHSYFQSGLRFSGKLRWGDVREDVEGGPGWIDRQWAERYLGVHNDRHASRYRHEWRQIHLENGIEMSVWTHFDRRRGNRVIPFSAVTAADSDGRVAATTEFQVERLSFVRDFGTVKPLYPLAGGGGYFADGYRLTVPAWDLDLVSQPIVPAPAHALPIEYWSGPTRLSGTMEGVPVEGFGFHERTQVFYRDFELLEVLRQTIRHLPDGAFRKGGGERAAALVWEIDAFLSRRDYEAALAFLRGTVRPELERIDVAERDHVLVIADDLADSLYHWWVRD